MRSNSTTSPRSTKLLTLFTAFTFAFLPFVAACSSDLGESTPYPSGGNSTYVPGGGPDPTDFSKYAQSCFRPTNRWKEAQLVFANRMTMKQERSSDVRVKLTLDKELPPETIMPDVKASAVPVKVSCEAEAAIFASKDDFDISPSPQDWRTQSVFEGQDADWQWTVRPKSTGDYEITVSIRPVILINQIKVDTRASTLVTTRPFEVPVKMTIHVKHRSWIEAGTDWLTTVNGFLAALGTPIVALASIYVKIRMFPPSAK